MALTQELEIYAQSRLVNYVLHTVNTDTYGSASGGHAAYRCKTCK